MNGAVKEVGCFAREVMFVVDGRLCYVYNLFNYNNYKKLSADTNSSFEFQSSCKGDSGGPVACRKSISDQFDSLVHFHAEVLNFKLPVALDSRAWQLSSWPE